MPRPTTSRLLAALAAATFPVAASANDDWASRVAIGTLPYADSRSIAAATTDVTDPVVPCRLGIGTGGNSVWYSYTTGAVPEYVNLTTAGSDYDTLLAVWTGAPGSFRLAAGCSDNGIAATTQSAGDRRHSAPASTRPLHGSRATSAAATNTM